MSDRAGVANYERFPYVHNEDGFHYCRVCATLLDDRRKTFCDPRCLRDFYMQTDWRRVRRVVFERDGGQCMKCGKKVTKDEFHVDHIVPISKGGAEWDLSNLELSCPKCNIQKGDR